MDILKVLGMGMVGQVVINRSGGEAVVQDLFMTMAIMGVKKPRRTVVIVTCIRSPPSIEMRFLAMSAMMMVAGGGKTGELGSGIMNGGIIRHQGKGGDNRKGIVRENNIFQGIGTIRGFNWIVVKGIVWGNNKTVVSVMGSIKTLGEGIVKVN